EILRVREQDRPLVADPLVKVDLAFGGFGGEIGGFVANADSHRCLRGVGKFGGIKIIRRTVSPNNPTRRVALARAPGACRYEEIFLPSSILVGCAVPGSSSTTSQAKRV